MPKNDYFLTEGTAITKNMPPRRIADIILRFSFPKNLSLRFFQTISAFLMKDLVFSFLPLLLILPTDILLEFVVVFQGLLLLRDLSFVWKI